MPRGVAEKVAVATSRLLLQIRINPKILLPLPIATIYILYYTIIDYTNTYIYIYIHINILIYIYIYTHYTRLCYIMSYYIIIYYTTTYCGFVYIYSNLAATKQHTSKHRCYPCRGSCSAFKACAFSCGGCSALLWIVPCCSIERYVVCNIWCISYCL